MVTDVLLELIAISPRGPSDNPVALHVTDWKKELIMRIQALAVLMLLATPVAAQTAAVAAAPIAATAIHKGQWIKDANNGRIGPVDRINVGADGNVASVKVIAGSQFATIPGDTLTLTDGALQTSMTKKDIAKLQ
jgi:hypothetical protein